jgi:oligoribonuclease NrnB/cAMP/cGMP phosphodiesterase (DHH superfamily)
MAKIYYHNDLDGRCAGAIALRSDYLKKQKEPCDLFEVDYNDEVAIDKIGLDETLIILDYSFKPAKMNRILEKTKNILWIDHHESAFEFINEYSRKIEGLRDGKYSACELAWKYFHGDNTAVPKAVILIGDHDRWELKYGEMSENFCIGMYAHHHHPKDEIWDRLLTAGSSDLIVEIRKEGSICRRVRDNFCLDYAARYGFECDFEGHKCFAMGLYKFGTEAFGEKIKTYDICISFEFDGNNYVVSLYSEKINVARIAERYGGGGHKGAAGFVMKELPIRKKR